MKLAFRVSEAAKESGCSRTVLYEAMATGALPWLQVGSRRLLLGTDLEAWLTAQRVPAGGSR